jgi:hypothetical protein
MFGYFQKLHFPKIVRVNKNERSTMTCIRYRNKPVWHETRTLYMGRPILIAETPSNLLMRLKGTRQILELPHATAYLRAATLKASSLALHKIDKKKAIARGKIKF